jgi:hypothetical protein
VFSWILTVERNEALSSEHESAPLTLYRIELDVRWRRHSKAFQRIYRTRRVAPQKEASTFAITFAGVGGGFRTRGNVSLGAVFGPALQRRVI